MSLGIPSYAMQVQGEMPFCRCSGIPQCWLFYCKVMYRVHFLFLYGKSFMDWTHFRSTKDLENQRSSAYKNHDFWLSVSGVHILGPCLFSNTIFLLILAQHWTKEGDLEDRKGPYTNENCNTLLSFLFMKFIGTFLFMKFIGVSVYTHLSIVLVVCLPAFVK